MENFFNIFKSIQAAEASPSLMADPNAFLQHYGNIAVEKTIFFVPKILVALIILSSSQNVDTTIGNLAASVIKYAILTATFLAAIAVVGVPVAKVFVILSAATLAIGLALQGSMANVAAGLLLIIFRPYKIGDYVEVGGDLNIFTTTLITLDNIKIIVSNSEVRSATIKNLSSMGVRRVDVDFGSKIQPRNIQMFSPSPTGHGPKYLI